MVKREVERWHHDVQGRFDQQLLSNPFVNSIMRIEYSIDFRLPNIKTYVERIDFESHVNACFESMMMMGLSDVVICRAFFSALEGEQPIGSEH